MAEEKKRDVFLEISDLSVEYNTEDGKVYAVNNVNLEVYRGETLGLVGETGAGKTTTALSVLKLLPNRTARITGGTIRLGGIDITKATEADMRLIRGNQISMVFQDPMTSLNPIIPVGDQIEESLILHTKLTKEERSKRVDELLTSVGIQPSRKNEYPHQFSGGMRQRIVIAIALACDPELLLADEPTTALDVTIQAQVLYLMRNLKNTMNTSMLLITHDLGVVAQTCDRVAVMYAGRIVEVGTVQDIYNCKDHHPYTVGLFQAIPEMNRDSERLSPIPGQMPDPSVEYSCCSFAERCPHATERCKKEMPGVYTNGSHSISCFLYENMGEKEE